MALFICPNEILEHIIWQVSSDDIENFSSTCRLLRKLSEPYLREHFKLKSQYGYKVNYPSQKSLHPAEILSAIIDNPTAASYIKALSLTFRPGRHTISGRVEELISKRKGFQSQINGNWHPSKRILVNASIVLTTVLRSPLDPRSRTWHVA